MSAQLKGKCFYCGKMYTRAGMTRHLQSCKARKAAMQMPLLEDDTRKKPRNAKIFHIKIQATYAPEHWLHVDVPADQMLQTLDRFLRDIWVECCGHLSAFEIDDVYYLSNTHYSDDQDMDVSLGSVLEPKMAFDYRYDFGSTTHLTLEIMAERTGEAQGNVVKLMARNNPLEWVCDVCGQPATQICILCMYDEDQNDLFCDKHAKEHECGEEMLLPVVNSPRMGVCGYIG